jgi:ABC-type phosphate/phosphonate transport system substrate-binding protein
MGIRLEKALTVENFFGSHEAATRAVLEDQADVASTHVSLDPVTGKLAAAPWLALGAKPADVRVLLLIGPIPGDVVSVSLRVEAVVRRQLVAALIAMKVDGSTRALFEASRFEPVPEGHLDMLRRLSRFSETRG